MTKNDEAFAARLKTGEPIIGTWVKTPHPHVVEVLARTPLDVVVLDAEHAPFDRPTLDLCILAARASGIPVLVRPQANDPAAILQALDGGATGVVVPHIRNGEDAERAVRSCRYIPNGRGYAGSTRAAGYTTRSMADHRAACETPLVIAQIEDRDALDDLEGIMSTNGLGGVFVGRADLAVSFGASSMDDAAVVEAVDRICEQASRHGVPLGMFLSRVEDVSLWREKGATFFFLGSDQSFMLGGATALAQSVRAQF
ncbi:MAG: aldolase/citrate lyase family protein [Litorimonas sp.]